MPVSGRTITLELRQEIEDFLYLEAELLDRCAFEQWLQLFTEDASYRMPVRTTHERRLQDREFDESFGHFDETREMLGMRVRRLSSRTAWAEDPPSRTRHFVTNLRIRATTKSDEILATTNLLVYRNRGDSPQHDLLSAERHDLLRRTESGWKISERRIYLDQATLGTLNLSIFL